MDICIQNITVAWSRPWARFVNGYIEMDPTGVIHLLNFYVQAAGVRLEFYVAAIVLTRSTRQTKSVVPKVGGVVGICRLAIDDKTRQPGFDE
jgi:hypothetical protein